MQVCEQMDDCALGILHTSDHWQWHCVWYSCQSMAPRPYLYGTVLLTCVLAGEDLDHATPQQNQLTGICCIPCMNTWLPNIRSAMVSMSKDLHVQVTSQWTHNSQDHQRYFSHQLCWFFLLCVCVLGYVGRCIYSWTDFVGGRRRWLELIPHFPVDVARSRCYQPPPLLSHRVLWCAAAQRMIHTTRS